MQLNTITPSQGSKKLRKRVGRGPGSGLGKTAGRGHKGQKARSGGYHKTGFEGGQMPLQRRVPKFGFNSRKVKPAVIRTGQLEILGGEVNLETLKKAGVIGKRVEAAKVIVQGELTKAVTVSGLQVSAGAKQAIENAGGTVAA